MSGSRSEAVLADRHMILVADDDPDITDLISSVLSEDNHRVVSVWDGSAAIDAALQETPDIVILDLNMPKSDGFEVIRRLRENASTKKTPIILLTANNDEWTA